MDDLKAKYKYRGLITEATDENSLEELRVQALGKKVRLTARYFALWRFGRGKTGMTDDENTDFRTGRNSSNSFNFAG